MAKALVADLAPDLVRRGAVFGIYNGVVGLTLLPASVIAGAFWQGVGAWGGFGPAVPFLFGGALALAAALLLWYWV